MCKFTSNLNLRKRCFDFFNAKDLQGLFNYSYQNGVNSSNHFYFEAKVLPKNVYLVEISSI